MSPRVSPDGQLLAFVAMPDGSTPAVGVMKLGSDSWTLLTRGSDEGFVQNVCWSRDGSKLYFDRYCMAPGWTADAKVICAGAALTASLWRYHAE